MGKVQKPKVVEESPADTPLRVFVGYGMKRAFNVVRADVNATLAPHGLRMATFSALSFIGHQPGLRQSALAELMAVEPPNLVALLDELEGGGLVARRRAQSDRRVYELWLTPDGETRLAEAHRDVIEHDQRMTRDLSDEERAALVSALMRIERTADGER